tara:strand:- start:889 stop:1275 length:387 start_codon:yes stop_codon:yes gene_type:complete
MWDTWEFYEKDVVKVTLKNSSPTTQQFEQFLQRILITIRRAERLGIVFDGAQIPSVTMSQVMAVVKFMKEHKNDIRDKFFASAIVIGSLLVDAALRFAFKLQPPSAPNLITRSVQEAMTFVSTAAEKK